MVRPGLTGLLAPEGDVEAMGRAIAHLLRNMTQRSKMADSCRQTAIRQYNLQIQANAYGKLYEELIRVEAS